MQVPKSITFDRFSGLDFSTTAKTLSYTGKKQTLGAEELYGFVRSGVIHPLPAFPSTILSKDGRFFSVWGSLYLLASDGLYKINSGETGFDLITAGTFDTTNRDSWKIVEFKTKGTSVVTLNVHASTASGSNYIKVATTIGENVYSGLQVEIFQGGTTSKGVYYVTTNTADTITVDGLLDYVPGSGDTITVYSPKDALVIYDGNKLYTWDNTTLTNIRTPGANAFIDVYYNRLYLSQGNKVLFTSLNTISYFPNTGYAYTEGTISDVKKIGTNVYIFTTQGTKVLSGTGYTTLNLADASDFKTSTTVSPVIYKDQLYINTEGRLYHFAQGLGTQYNYRLIPDTASRLFVIKEGIIFNLGHTTTTKWGCLNIEEIENRQQIVITNFVDSSLRDLTTYNGKIYINDGGVIKKESGTSPIIFTSNLISYSQRVFWDSIYLLTAGTPPASIDYYTQGAWKNQLADTYGNRTDYQVKKYDTGLKVKVTSTDPIVSVTMNFKI